MVSKAESPIGMQNIPAGVMKTIESIREIVGNHSDADIYAALKDAHMDPNETTQKLLHQDPFHEVRRRRDKKKEIQNEGPKSFTPLEHRQNFGQVGQERKLNSRSNQNVRRTGSIRASGVSHQFRVVRDNRVNQNEETNVAVSSTPTDDPALSAAVNSSSAGTSSDQKPPVGRQLLHSRNGPSQLQPKQSREVNPVGTGKKAPSEDKQTPLPNSQLPPKQSREVDSVGTSKKVPSEDKQTPLPNSGTRLQNVKASNTQLDSTTASNSSAVGVYSSSSDPVHVPSRDSKQAANVGTIKREVGVVGSPRQSSEPGKLSSASSNLPSNQSKNLSSGSTAPPASVGRSISNNNHNSRAHQSAGHPKAPQRSKQWKPKRNKKAAANGVGVVGTLTQAASPSDNLINIETKAAQVKDIDSPVNASEYQNVIIASHIRVSESDRYRLTFGSLGAEFETTSSGTTSAGIAEVSTSDHSVSVSVSPPVSSGEPAQKEEFTVDTIQTSDSNSTVSAPPAKPELADKKVPSGSQIMDTYEDVGLIQDNSRTYSVSEPQQQVASELLSSPAYEQAGYNVPYLRAPVDEAFRRRGLHLPQEALNSQASNSISGTTISLSQQQQLAQMYPQLHYMPYRQVFSPFYVPPMAMPAYSSNPAYPHPSNGNSFMLMSGGSSHLTPGGVKYGMQQFKPVHAASPNGFGNYSNPTGYAMNTPGVVGGGIHPEDASRPKYKDSNLYVPNAQAQANEMWMNKKEIPSMHSASYYNMPGQTPHGSAYMPSHPGHASFNAGAAAAAAAQSSHMHFPGMYHNPQPGPIAAPHPMGGAMVGNVGASTAPLPQMGAYQQPQMGHMNWTGNRYEYS